MLGCRVVKPRGTGGCSLRDSRHHQELDVRSESLLQWVHTYKRCCVVGGWLALFLVLARSHVPELVGRNFLVGRS